MIEEGKIENRDCRNPEAGNPQPKKKPLNTAGAIAAFPRLAQATYRGEKVGTWCALAMMIIAENSKNGQICTWSMISSQFGTSSHPGKYVAVLERLGLAIRPAFDAYALTVDGELFVRGMITDLNRILESRPIKRKHKSTDPDNHGAHPWLKPKGMYVKRPMAPIETFNQLVEEVLSKKGVNKKAKYVLLRTLGMKAKPAKEAIAKLANGTHTDKIKPILKDILSELASQSDQKA